MEMNRSILVGIVLASILLGCASSNELSKEDLIATYGSARLDLAPEIHVFHHSKDSTEISIRFNSENLLYSRREDDEYAANVEIVLEPVSGQTESGKVLEKTIYKVPDILRKHQGKDVLASAMIELPFGAMYDVEITIKDRSSGKRYNQLIRTYKDSPNNRNNFSTSESDNPLPVFSDRIKPEKTYEIAFSLSDTVTRVYVNYYDRSFPLPPPPFTFYEPKPFDFNPDDQFVLESSEGKFNLSSRKKGFYHFRIDTSIVDGYSLFISADEFPEVQEVRNMLEPFRYLVSGKEYKSILEAPDLKTEIERYWIDWAGDQGRARNSIKAYYSRVELANKHFSSHLEGWKSDRGLIYLVYGKPDKIYRTAELETWIYGEERNPLSLTFRFLKVENPFTNNDYRLNREDYFKPSWYRSIEAWRNGRVY